MSCERYWSDGILLAERGEPDPHRDGCISCRREHRARGGLLHALPIVAAASPSDSAWQARVWTRIAQLERPRPAHRWRLRGLVAMAFASASMCLPMCILGWPWRAATQMHLEIAFVPGNVATRSASRSPEVGDHVRITTNPADEIRVYCRERLILRCPARSNLGGCRSDARATVATLQVPPEGHCWAVSLAAAGAPPVGDLYRDMQVIVAAGGGYQITGLSAE